MATIPDDIMKSARDAWFPVSDASKGDAVTIIAGAIMAERERCALIAEDEDGHFSYWGEDSNTKVSQQTCRDAAAAIRK